MTKFMTKCMITFMTKFMTKFIDVYPCLKIRNTLICFLSSSRIIDRIDLQIFDVTAYILIYIYIYISVFTNKNDIYIFI